MNRDDVIDVLSVVAAATRRTVGEADVAIWSEIIGGDDKQLALKAVRDHLADQPGVWLEPGHVHQRVRAMVRDQLEREPDQLRGARQTALEAKAARDIDQLTRDIGRPDYTRPSQAHAINPLSVRCPYEPCRANVGYVCVNTAFKGGKPRSEPHPSRVDAAHAAAGATA